MLTEVANILSDAMVMGERSGLSTAAAEYESQGLDRQSAWFRATLDSLGQIGWAGAGGFLSGVGMAGGKVALQQGSTAIYDGLTHQRQGTAQDAQIDVEGARTDAQTGADTPAAENPVEGAKSAPVEGAVVKADTSVLDGHILRDLNLARASFIEFARQHFPSSVKNTETGREIGISRRGLDKFLSGRIPYEKYASGFHIPELIERAHLVTNADNTHLEQAESIPTYDYYDSPIEIDGKNYMAHIRVRNTMMGDKYYGHTISEIDDIKIEPSARTSVPGETPAVQLVNAIDGSINSIPQPGQEVNPEAGDGMPNSVAAAARFEYQEAPTQAVSDRLFTDMQRRDVPDLRTEPHKIYTEAEANADVRERLAFDYDGEKVAPETMVYLPVGNVTGAFGNGI